MSKALTGNQLERLQQAEDALAYVTTVLRELGNECAPAEAPWAEWLEEAHDHAYTGMIALGSVRLSAAAVPPLPKLGAACVEAQGNLEAATCLSLCKSYGVPINRWTAAGLR